MEFKFLRSLLPGSASAQPLGGHYEVIQQLGAGGFGQTFVARDLHLPGQPTCVIKQFKPQAQSEKEFQVARRLFDTEARVLYKLGVHPQIPQLLAHFEHDNEFYLAQELVQGRSLADELDIVAPWSDVQTVAFLGDILRTLAFVHENRVIHRDLKPSNLMRRQRDNRIVLIDFGAVKQASTQFINSDTGIGQTISIGTQGYMPNEQTAGRPQFSSDVYAIGIIGIQVLTGRHPRLLMPHPQTGELDWHADAPDTDPALKAVLDRMVRWDFRSRFATATEALAALEALPDELTQAIPPPMGVNTVHVSPGSGAYSNQPKAEPPALKVEEESLTPETPAPVDSPRNAETGASSVFMGTTVHAAEQPPLAEPPLVEPPLAEPPLVENEVRPAAMSSPAVRSSPAAKSSARGSRRQTLPVLGRHPKASAVPRRRMTGSSMATEMAALSQMVQTRTVPTLVILGGVLGVGLLLGRACMPSTAESNSSPVTAGAPATTEASAENEKPVAAPAASQGGTAATSETTAATEADADAAKAAELRALLQQAEQLRAAGQHADALARYDEAIAQDAAAGDAHAGRCYSLNRLQRYSEAIAACEQAIGLDNDNVRALWSKGYALEQQENYQEALGFYDQAIKTDGTFAAAWNNKGTALLRLRDSAGAVVAFDEAIALDPNFAEAWSNRGAALWDQRQFGKALESVNRALEIQPDNQDAANLQREMRRRLDD